MHSLGALQEGGLVSRVLLQCASTWVFWPCGKGYGCVSSFAAKQWFVLSDLLPDSLEVVANGHGS